MLMMIYQHWCLQLMRGAYLMLPWKVRRPCSPTLGTGAGSHPLAVMNPLALRHSAARQGCADQPLP